MNIIASQVIIEALIYVTGEFPVIEKILADGTQRIKWEDDFHIYRSTEAAIEGTRRLAHNGLASGRNWRVEIGVHGSVPQPTKSVGGRDITANVASSCFDLPLHEFSPAPQWLTDAILEAAK